jgi:hypothetical protein
MKIAGRKEEMQTLIANQLEMSKKMFELGILKKG